MTRWRPGVLAGLLAGLVLGTGGTMARQPAEPALYQVEIVVFRPGSGAPAAVPGPGALPGSPAPISASDLRLGGVARRLGATGYRPLLHAAWRQPGGLFLETDATVAGLGPPDPAGTPAVVRIRETRRIRNGNLHYFDHPDFGVIASVRPVGAGDAAPSD